jgi:hypothetical protein
MEMESKEKVFFSRIVAKDQEKKKERWKVIGLDRYQEGNEFQENRSNWTLVKSINETCTVRVSNANKLGMLIMKLKIQFRRWCYVHQAD